MRLLSEPARRSGAMKWWCLEKNDSESPTPALDEWLDEHRRAAKVHLIWDGAPSRTSAATQTSLPRHRAMVRVLLTPAHASWLNQDELPLRAFSGRYLKRGDWAGRAPCKATCRPPASMTRKVMTPDDWDSASPEKPPRVERGRSSSVSRAHLSRR